MWSDFFFLCLHNLRVGRSLSDDGAQPQPLSESLHSVPPSSPLEKHFLYGDFRAPKAAQVVLLYFPSLLEHKTLSLRMGWNDISVGPYLLQYSALLVIIS